MPEFDPSSLPPRTLYKLLVQTVVPRPIAWVSTVDAEGRPNLAPFSFFNAFSSAPPVLAIGIGEHGDRPKDTLANALETGELVVNTVPERFAEGMVATSAVAARGVNEFDLGGVTAEPSARVRPPRVAESPVSLECIVWDTIRVDRSRASPPGPVAKRPSTILLAEVVHARVADEAVTDAEPLRIDVGALAPVARLGGIEYWRRGERFAMERPGA